MLGISHQDTRNLLLLRCHLTPVPGASGWKFGDTPLRQQQPASYLGFTRTSDTRAFRIKTCRTRGGRQFLDCIGTMESGQFRNQHLVYAPAHICSRGSKRSALPPGVDHRVDSSTSFLKECKGCISRRSLTSASPRLAPSWNFPAPMRAGNLA
jgi:hypothetical protein